MPGAADDEFRSPNLWGGFSTFGGGEISVVGLCAQWLLYAAVCALVIETALIEWGSGTWPQADVPSISLGVMAFALAVILVDVIAVGLHNWWVSRRHRRRREAS